MKFPSWLPCWLVWKLTFWTHTSLSQMCMKANLWKLRQAPDYSSISLSYKLLTQCTNTSSTAQKVQVSWSSSSHTQGCEVSTWYLIMFLCLWMASVSTFFHWNLKKKIVFFSSKTSTASLFLRKFVLVCLGFFLCLSSWWHYIIISLMLHMKLLYKLGLLIFHTSFHKSTA